MNNIVTILISILLLFLKQASAEVAIIPYKIKNPSIYFTLKTGAEYSKLLSVASMHKKKIDISSPRDVEIDLKNFNIRPQGTITEDHLEMYGKSRYLDYILTGSLSKVKNGYISKSILYSIKDKRAVFKIYVKAKNLYKLAERETKQAFINFSNISINQNSLSIDALFLLDISYNVNKEWKTIKKSIINVTSNLVDKLGVDTRIYLVPFSDKITIQKSSISENSILDVKNKLNRLKPVGGTNPENFSKAFRYTVRNIKWRKNAKKTIILISNSNLNRSKEAEVYSTLSRNKGIAIYTLSLGKISGDKSEMLKRIANIARGSHKNITYHQKLFNRNGQPFDLYIENNRLFKSKFYYNKWKDGILLRSRYNQNIEKPKNFVSEIYYNDDKILINPYDIPYYFTKITGERIINKKNAENNINEIISNIFNIAYNERLLKKQIGKVLLTDSKISFWVPVYNVKEINFYEEKKQSGYIFPFGFYIRNNSKEAYGISFYPVIFNLTADYIPDLLRSNLHDIIKNKKYYMNEGLFYPPIWFTNVKVLKINRSAANKDIRDF